MVVVARQDEVSKKEAGVPEAGLSRSAHEGQVSCCAYNPVVRSNGCQQRSMLCRKRMTIRA